MLYFTQMNDTTSPVVLEASSVIAVEDVPPAVDVNNASGDCDEQHQCQLHHVTDLNQHGGGHQCQHCDVAIIFGVVQAATRAKGEGGSRCGAAQVCDLRLTTQLDNKDTQSHES